MMKLLRQIIPYLVIVCGTLLVAAGFNLFLIPHQLLSGGASGVAMFIGYYSGWSIGLLYFLINLPILIWGWFAIGRYFIILSILSVIMTTWFIEIIPVKDITLDPILGSVFGGVVIGIGTGYSLKFGGSTGGFDILGSIITKYRDFPLGTVIFILNASVVVALGTLNNWNLALYSMLSIYVTGKIVDTIHMRHVKVTAFIVTNETSALVERLLTRPRGITMMKTQGAFSHKEKDMLMTVTTRYELAELRRTIREVDPKAFVNVVETVEIMGEFRRSN